MVTTTTTYTIFPNAAPATVTTTLVSTLTLPPETYEFTFISTSATSIGFTTTETSTFIYTLPPIYTPQWSATTITQTTSEFYTDQETGTVTTTFAVTEIPDRITQTDRDTLTETLYHSDFYTALETITTTFTLTEFPDRITQTDTVTETPNPITTTVNVTATSTIYADQPSSTLTETVYYPSYIERPATTTTISLPAPQATPGLESPQDAATGNYTTVTSWIYSTVTLTAATTTPSRTSDDKDKWWTYLSTPTFTTLLSSSLSPVLPSTLPSPPPSPISSPNPTPISTNNSTASSPSCQCARSALAGIYCGYCSQIRSCERGEDCWANAYSCGETCAGYGALEHCAEAAVSGEGKENCPFYLA